MLNNLLGHLFEKVCSLLIVVLFIRHDLEPWNKISRYSCKVSALCHGNRSLNARSTRSIKMLFWLYQLTWLHCFVDSDKRTMV